MTTDEQSESQNGYPVDIKYFEADQDRDGATIRYVGATWSHVAKDRKLWKACREGFLLRETETP